MTYANSLSCRMIYDVTYVSGLSRFQRALIRMSMCACEPPHICVCVCTAAALASLVFAVDTLSSRGSSPRVCVRACLHAKKIIKLSFCARCFLLHLSCLFVCFIFHFFLFFFVSFCFLKFELKIILIAKITIFTNHNNYFNSLYACINL